jgi:hypothetical protein
MRIVGFLSEIRQKQKRINKIDLCDCVYNHTYSIEIFKFIISADS